MAGDLTTFRHVAVCDGNVTRAARVLHAGVTRDLIPFFVNDTSALSEVGARRARAPVAPRHRRARSIATLERRVTGDARL
jgi:hypothetical protein